MKNALFLLTTFTFIVSFLSCEERNNILKPTSDNSFIDQSFLNYDFKEFGIEPIWNDATVHSNILIELPYNINAKSAKVKLNKDGTKQGKSSLLMYKENGRVVAQLIYFFPNSSYNISLDEIDTQNYSSKNFDGIFMFQKLTENNMHVRFIENGQISKKVLGVKASANARLMGCELWGAYLVQYDNYGNVTSERLLYTYDVCSGGSDPTQEQAGPGPQEGGSWPAEMATMNQQLILNIQSEFNWLRYSIYNYTTNKSLYESLRGCNIYGILSSPSGPPESPSSYQATTSNVGYCMYGSFTPNSTIIVGISPSCTGCGYSSPIYSVETFHSGNISINIEASIQLGPAGEVGGTVAMNRSVGTALSWIRM